MIIGMACGVGIEVEGGCTGPAMGSCCAPASWVFSEGDGVAVVMVVDG